MGRKQRLAVVHFRTEADLHDAAAPHVAVVGRSNVGKSSLLNALLNRQVAGVSKTPGRTKRIDLFPYRNGYLADLPGYGYARVGDGLQDKWDQWIATYYRQNPYLAGTMILVDARHPATDRDMELRQWLSVLDFPYFVVLTKWDQLTRSQYTLKRKEHAVAWQCAPENLVPCSAKSKYGLDAVADTIQLLMDRHNKATTNAPDADAPDPDDEPA